MLVCPHGGLALGKVVIQIDSDAFDRLYGTKRLIARFEGAPPDSEGAIPTLDLAQAEVEAAAGEVQELGLTKPDVEPVDDPGS